MLRILVRPYFYSLIAVVAAIVAVLVAAHTAGLRASRENQMPVAFIDFPLLMQESDVGKSINAQVEPKKKAFQDQAQAKFKEFKQEEGDIRANRNSMNAAEFDEKNKVLQQKVAEWNDNIQKRQNDLNNAVSAAIVNIKQVLQGELVAIAAENNISTILPAELAFFQQKKLDVTPEAIRRLNEKLAKIDLKLEEPKEIKAEPKAEDKEEKPIKKEEKKKDKK